MGSGSTHGNPLRRVAFSHESDRMCYQDGPDVVMTQVCPTFNEAYLDCNHDDFYHPSPPAGSYLATHWNTVM